MKKKSFILILLVFFSMNLWAGEEEPESATQNTVGFTLLNTVIDGFKLMASKGSGGYDQVDSMIQKAMADVYGDTPPEDIQAIGTRTVQAINLIPQLPWPVIPMLEDFDHVYYTGLQLAKDPGMNVVWVGSAILVIGLCIMFYVPHRKLWLVIRP